MPITSIPNPNRKISSAFRKSKIVLSSSRFDVTQVKSRCHFITAPMAAESCVDSTSLLRCKSRWLIQIPNLPERTRREKKPVETNHGGGIEHEQRTGGRCNPINHR